MLSTQRKPLWCDKFLWLVSLLVKTGCLLTFQMNPIYSLFKASLQLELNFAKWEKIAKLRFDWKLALPIRSNVCFMSPIGYLRLKQAWIKMECNTISTLHKTKLDEFSAHQVIKISICQAGLTLKIARIELSKIHTIFMHKFVCFGGIVHLNQFL